MKFYGGICIVITIFTMLATLIILAALAFVSITNAEESTKYPILLPSGSGQRVVEFLELQNESAIDWENGFKKCGTPVEGCPINSNDRDTKNITINQNETLLVNLTVQTPFKSLVDFKEQPTFCRCDEKCVRYGDCCASVLTKMRKIPKDTHWRCKRLLNTKHYVRMISICPSDVPSDDINKRLCESADTTCPTIELYSNSNYANHYCPLLDVPVYNNRTGNLYRSIFCARCHSVVNHDIQPMTHEILCSSNFTSRKEWEEFSKRAVYQRGKLRWFDPNNGSLHCSLYIKQLQPDVIKDEIPDARFCFGAKEDCSLDLSTEENLVVYNLCFSYTLIVIVKKGPEYLPYKNPHCAKCEDPSIDIRRTPTCYRTTPRDRGGMGPPGIGTRMFAAETVPVGINILFHFSLDMDDGYVGFTSKCEEDEILDFIRHKCVPVICPKNYELIDGKCEKLSVDTSIDDDNNDTSVLVPRGTNSSNSSDFSNSSEPCFLIIFHNGEYSQLENGSLAVNKSGGAGGVLIFQPGEYQKYEGDGSNISMSICAKHVERTFESSFAPALSYISNILLIVSVLCTLIHVALYIVLPKMRNLPGNNLLCLTTCLLISHIIFLAFINTSNHTMCLIASITMHYFLLSGFVWMFVMSFDIWRTFSSEFVVRRYSGDSKCTFIKYSVFAWTLPLVIVTLAAITDFALPESVLLNPVFGPVMKKLRPLYGHNNLCWIGQRLSLFAFFALPVGLIILCNLILFARTAVTIWIQNKEGSRFINGAIEPPGNSGNNMRSGGNTKAPLQSRNSGSTKKSDKIRFKLYAKLALIMGLTWILGLLSGFTEWEWLWYPFVIFNGLQGTFIFVAFDCEPKVLKMVKDVCGWSKRNQRKGDTGDGTSSSNSGTRRTTTTTLSSILGNHSGKSNDNIFDVRQSPKGKVSTGTNKEYKA